MHNEPYRAERRWLIGPDADEVGAVIGKKTGQFGNANAIGRGLQLDERIVTTERYSCAFQRLVHEERTCRGRSTRESYEIALC
jgi:hypothetical protein